jgi:hypothetical protein
VCHGKLSVARWRGRVQTVLGQCGVTHRAGVDARDPALVVNQPGTCAETLKLGHPWNPGTTCGSQMNLRESSATTVAIAGHIFALLTFINAPLETKIWSTSSQQQASIPRFLYQVANIVSNDP